MAGAAAQPHVLLDGLSLVLPGRLPVAIWLATAFCCSMVSPISFDLRRHGGDVVRVYVSMRHQLAFEWILDESMRPFDPMSAAP